MNTPNVIYDDVHVYPLHEVDEHNLKGGPSGCDCEPEVDLVDICKCGHFIKRVIVHQDMSKAKPAEVLVGTCAGIK
jgi:hypothetical protein